MKKVLSLLVMLVMVFTAKAYDFTAIAPSGQTLYYNIINGEAQVTFQNSEFSPYTTVWPSGNLSIPSSVTYAGVVYPVTSIGDYAFLGCEELTSVSITSTVVHIGFCTFLGCINLDSIIIPNSVTSIGDFSFLGCSSLTSVSLSDSIVSIGLGAFSECTNLNSITVSSGNPIYDSRNNCNGIVLTASNTLICACSTTSIPNSITCIGDYAFFGCFNLTSITIPNAVISIGNYAFYYCINLDTVFMEGEIPPILGNYCFDSNAIDRVFILSCHSYDSYYTELTWEDYRDYLHDPIVLGFSIDIVSHNPIYGMADALPLRNNIIRCDSSVVVLATSNYGYHFDHWSNGSTSNPDTLFISGDSIVTAYFAKNQYTVTALTNQGDRGSVTGSATVDYLDNVTLTATANYGYHFSHWSDGSTENPHQVTANENKTIYAYFDPNQYLLNVLSADGTMGNVSGSGSFDYLSNRTISASPNYGYHFVQWNDGVATNSRTVTLTQDTTFTALFGKNQYTLNVLSNDASLGTVTGSGTYEYLDNAEITATAIEHYHFVRWSDGNTSNPRNYQVTEDATIIAIFAIDSHYVNVTCDIARGTVSGSGYYAYGSACTVTAENTYTGFVFHSWSNGVTANPYVFAVLDDMEVYAIFVAEGEEVYTVTVESADPSMGTASGGGQALSGGEVVIWATSNPGHRFVRWNDNNTDSVRTVVVTADVTYTAYFEATTQSINDVMEEDIRIFVQNGQIVVDGVDDKDVRVFDMYGRLVDNRMLSPGVYLVIIGTHPARKVVVIR